MSVKSFFITVILIVGLLKSSAQNVAFKTDVFLYGTNVYPEIQTREEQIKMLDLFSQAGYTVLRLGESAWGNLEPAPGKFDFGWLRFFLDEMQKRNIKAILGTCSFIPPIWLTAKNPEMLWQYEDGNYANPMSRHAISRNHTAFRTALQKFILAYGNEFKDHLAVIGWQLDNEIELTMNFYGIDQNPMNQKSWKLWLNKNYHNAAEANQRLGFRAWGWQVQNIDAIPMPSKGNDGNLATLRLAYLHYQRDNIMEYFTWQKGLLRKAGVKQWVTTDLNMLYNTIADASKPLNPLDISAINMYQPTSDNPNYWAEQGMYSNIHRSASNGKFLLTETRIGPTGGAYVSDEAATKSQFFMWMLEPAAFGANCIMHWSGNRFTGGHWPHWGGLLDWSGKPEPDFEWTKDIAAFYKKWGKTIIETTVDAQAAVLTDFDQRAALETYPHAPNKESLSLLAGAFNAFHRNGIGVDAITSVDAMDYNNLKKYKILVLAAAPCLDDSAIKSSLLQFVENGGILIVSPFTAYQTWEGIFKSDGFASGLEDVIGSKVQSIRLLSKSSSFVEHLIMNRDTLFKNIPVAMSGFTERLTGYKEQDVIARFTNTDEVMAGKPAVIYKKSKKGYALKFAFWPDQDIFSELIGKICQFENPIISQTVVNGVQIVPRTDKSVFVINTMGKAQKIVLAKPMNDRITGTQRSANFELKPYEILWLNE